MPKLLDEIVMELSRNKNFRMLRLLFEHVQIKDQNQLSQLAQEWPFYDTGCEGS
jgi:hypothetical protein